ncbi:hypothetical protein PM082_010363 [Marasmius tenuissimus]|nr:hypothetical protein PM082_010363 [Marasmius tenuissimus]
MLKKHRGDPAKVLEKDPQIVPEDNGMIIFTSGSTGLPKGVLLSQRAFLTAIGNAIAGRGRAILRRGEEFPPPPEEGPQPGLLLPTPLFHVTGTTLITLSLAQGLKVVLMRKWDVKEGDERSLVSSNRILLMRAVFQSRRVRFTQLWTCSPLNSAFRLIKAENIKAAGGVPSTVVDLIEGGASGLPLESVMFGGAPVSTSVSQSSKMAFPGSTNSQAYGQSECNATAIGFSGEDFDARPTACGRAMPVNDILIMKDDIESPTGQPGEIWIRGPNVMKEYWDDPAATAKVSDYNTTRPKFLLTVAFRPLPKMDGSRQAILVTSTTKASCMSRID